MSRITGGATANTQGQLAQTVVRDFLQDNLSSAYSVTRNGSLKEVEKILKKYKPKGVFLENVRGLSTHDNGRTLKTILHSLFLGFRN